MTFHRAWPTNPDEFPKGFKCNEPVVLSEYQRECMKRFSHSLDFEQRSYIQHHPEILEIVRAIIKSGCTMADPARTTIYMAQYYEKMYQKLDQTINNLQQRKSDKMTHFDAFDDERQDLVLHLMRIKAKFNQMSDESHRPSTESSSFISIVTSPSTFSSHDEEDRVATPTIYDMTYQMISKIVDKAAFCNYSNYEFLYDTAYVEIMKCVENAMEITVEEVKIDIHELFRNAYSQFNEIIMERAKEVAKINWQRRMRKKLKKSLRRMENFKGYKTPPSTVKSIASSHESYKQRMPPPCPCNPQLSYNRYPKDRFGIYLPKDQGFCKESVTRYPPVDGTENDGDPLSD